LQLGHIHPGLRPSPATSRHVFVHADVILAIRMETFEVTGNVSLRTEHSIRLLKIVRTAADEDAEPTWDDSLICTNTQDALEYETLSYVWGTPNRNKFLKLLDGTLVAVNICSSQRVNAQGSESKV
jgi:hypothetical protein